MGEDDAKLIARVAAGDLGHPLEELYDRYAARLHGLGLRLLGDPGLAEELVQETFVRLWQSADRYDPKRGSVPSFVFTIARRLAIDLWRRPSSKPFTELGEVDRGPDQDPGDLVDQLLVGLNVRDALASLPEGGYFEHWMEALDELDQALPARAQPACPNCGRRELRAQYIGDPEDRIGYGAIWCNHCHWGARTGRTEIPAAADMLPFSASDEALRARIPSFRETPNQLDDDIIDQGWGSEAQPTDYGEMPER